MFQTRLLTAAAVMTLALGGTAYAQSLDAGATTPDASVQADATASQPGAPVRSRSENNRMSKKAENRITADLNQQQLQGQTSTTLATSADTGLRTPDNSSVEAGSLASPTPATATGDTVAPTDDSTLPPSQTETPFLPKATTEALPDEGKPGTNVNPTDAADKPEVQ